VAYSNVTVPLAVLRVHKTAEVCVVPRALAWAIIPTVPDWPPQIRQNSTAKIAAVKDHHRFHDLSVWSQVAVAAAMNHLISDLIWTSRMILTFSSENSSGSYEYIHLCRRVI
jgi:hypothetical protein